MSKPKSSLTEFAASSDMKTAYGHALRKIDQLKRGREDLIEAVMTATKDAVQMLDIPAVPRPKLKHAKGTPEVAIAMLSDWQLAKVTPTYNSEVCATRIDAYADKLERLVSIQRASYPVKELRVYLLGDIVEGEMIFPGQAHRIDASLNQQVMVGSQIIAKFVRRMLAFFETVRVVGVCGNHGAVGGPVRREHRPETNMDMLTYWTAEQIVRQDPDAWKRCSWTKTVRTGERLWYAVDKIGEKRFFLIHGDQIRGQLGFPWYGLGKSVHGWKNGGVPEDFDYVAHGHFHTPNCTPIGTVMTWTGRRLKVAAIKGVRSPVRTEPHPSAG